MEYQILMKLLYNVLDSTKNIFFKLSKNKIILFALFEWFLFGRSKLKLFVI